jgi:hypothetical protein
MFKRKLYGKKHPATRAIQAQLNMWAGVAGEKNNEKPNNRDNASAETLLSSVDKRRSKKNV